MLKKLLIAIPVLFILLLAGATIAFKYVGNDFVELQAQYQLERMLNRKVTIDGHFSLTRTTQPTLTASNIKIASASWDPDNYLVQANEVTIKVDAILLLFGIISIDSVKFDKATMNIIINKEGVSNFDFGASKGGISALSFYQPKIHKVELNDINIFYQNRQRDTEYNIYSDKLTFIPLDDRDEEMYAVGRFEDQDIEISGKMCRWSLLFGGEDCSVSAQISSPPFNSKVSGDITIAEKGYINMSIDITGKNINELKLPIKTYLPDTETAQASFLLSGDLDSVQLSKLKSNFTFSESKASISGSIKSIDSFSGLQLKIYTEGTDGTWLNQYQKYFPGELIDHYTLSGEVSDHDNEWQFNNIEASAKIDETTLFGKGDITIGEAPISLNLNINGRGKHPEWIDQLQNDINAKYIDDLRVDFDLVSKNNLWTIENLESTALTEDHTFTANGNIGFSTDQTTKVDLIISSSGRNLYSLARVIKYDLPESTKFAIKSKLKYEKPTLALTDASVVIDDTSISGNAEIDLLSHPNIRAKLRSESLDVEHVLALTEDLREKPSNEDSSGNQPLFSDEPLDLDWLEKADSNVDLKIDKIIYKEAQFQNLDAKLIENKGIGDLTINSIHYSGADLAASFKTDINTKTHTYHIHTENFDIGKLFKQTNTTDLLTGKLDFNLDINTVGTSTQELAENVRGGFTAFILDGSLDNASIDLLATNLVKELLPGKKPESRVEIECFFSQFHGENGILKSKATLLNTSHIVMTASGDINLGKDKYDLRLIPKPKNTSFFTLDSDVLVTGPLNDPVFTISKGSLLIKVLQSASVLALGPVGLALPFTTMGSGKYTECFEEVAEGTTNAVKAQQDSLSDAESQKKDEAPAKPKVESLNY